MIYKLNINIDGLKTLEDLRDFIKLNDIDIIFFAETHGLLDELKIQENIIAVLKPTCYLYELLEEKKIISDNDFIEFLKKKGSERFSIISSFSELKPTIQLARKYNLSIIGCDISNMCRKNKDFLKKNNACEEEKIMFEREKKQSKVIKESLIQYKCPIFVSVGYFHLRKDSQIFKEIKSNYIIIYPLVDKRRLEDLEENFNIDNIKEVRYIIESIKDGKQNKS